MQIEHRFNWLKFCRGILVFNALLKNLNAKEALKSILLLHALVGETGASSCAGHVSTHAVSHLINISSQEIKNSVFSVAGKNFQIFLFFNSPKMSVYNQR